MWKFEESKIDKQLDLRRITIKTILDNTDSLNYDMYYLVYNQTGEVIFAGKGTDMSEDVLSRFVIVEYKLLTFSEIGNKANLENWPEEGKDNAIAYYSNMQTMHLKTLQDKCKEANFANSRVILSLSTEEENNKALEQYNNEMARKQILS